MYKAYITRLKEVRKHKNADRLQMATLFGNDVVIGLDYKEGDLGIYFPSDGKLGKEFAEVNNLVRKKDEFGNNIGGYLDPDKRHIRAIRLRDERSDGLWLPIKTLETFGDISKLKEGDTIDVFNGILICEKYVPYVKPRRNGPGNKVKGKIKTTQFPTFKEHKDTEQLMYNLDRFKKGDTIYITLKLHGTSQRTGYLPKKREFKWYEKIIKKLFKIEPKLEYDYVTGTRKVVLESFDKDTSFYGGDRFRETHHNFFKGKLHKGETVYYEVVGYTDSDALIMPEVDNKKLNDKEFVKQFGDKTKYTYGCYSNDEAEQLIHEKIIKDDFRLKAMSDFFNSTFINYEQLNNYPQNKIFVYRMTITNEDGHIVEYPTELVQRRCEEMGVKMVPIFEKFIYTTKAPFLKRVEKHTDGIDPIGKTHIREGVVVRIDNSPTFTALKNKSFQFKVLEGIAKADAVEADIEESQ